MPFNTPDESLTEDENKWFSASIGGDIPLHKNTSCYSTNFFDDSRSSKAGSCMFAHIVPGHTRPILINGLATRSLIAQTSGQAREAHAVSVLYGYTIIL